MRASLPMVRRVSGDESECGVVSSLSLLVAGSGKSYTMMGSLVNDELKGIIPRLCDTLFDRIADVSRQYSLIHF